MEVLVLVNPRVIVVGVRRASDTSTRVRASHVIEDGVYTKTSGKIEMSIS